MDERNHKLGYIEGVLGVFQQTLQEIRDSQKDLSKEISEIKIKLSSMEQWKRDIAYFAAKIFTIFALVLSALNFIWRWLK